MALSSLGSMPSSFGAALLAVETPELVAVFGRLGLHADAFHPQLVRFASGVRDEHGLAALVAQHRNVRGLHARALDELLDRNFDDLRLLQRQGGDQRRGATGHDQPPAAPERDALPEPAAFRGGGGLRRGGGGRRPHRSGRTESGFDPLPHAAWRCDFRNPCRHRREALLPFGDRTAQRRVLAHPGLETHASATAQRAEHVLGCESILQRRLVPVPHPSPFTGCRGSL